MAKNSKDIDNLTRDVLAAEKAGMSYGKYKAANYVPEKKVKGKPPKKLDYEEEYQWNATCVVCSGVFRKRTWNQKTCSERCREIWNRSYFQKYRDNNKPAPIHYE